MTGKPWRYPGLRPSVIEMACAAWWNMDLVLQFMETGIVGESWLDMVAPTAADPARKLVEWIRARVLEMSRGNMPPDRSYRDAAAIAALSDLGWEPPGEKGADS